MCVVIYAIRQKKDKNKYYRRSKPGEPGGWVDGIQKASVWAGIRGPNHILFHVGRENADVVPITGLMQEGEYETVYYIRHKITGLFITNRKQRVHGNFYSKRWDNAGIWTRKHYAKQLLRSWETYCKWPTMLKYNLNIRREDHEIIKMPIFIPKKEML